jgi:hypothetical protein
MAMPQALPPPPPVIPMPQIDPEQMQAMFATATAVSWEEVEAILRSDKRRGYKVDIETDNTAQVDNDAEKASRIEFLSTMQGFMERVVPAIMQAPALAPLAHELVMFGVGAFKVGRTLEESFNDTFTQLEEMAKAQAQNGPAPDPKAQLAAAQAKKMETETQIAVQTAQRDTALASHDAMLAQQKAADDHMETQAKVGAMSGDAQAKNAERMANRGIAQQEAHRKNVETAHQINMDHQGASHEGARAAADIAIERERHALDVNKTLVEHDADMQQRAWETQLATIERHQKMLNDHQKMLNEARKAAQPPAPRAPRGNGQGVH